MLIKTSSAIQEEDTSSVLLLTLFCSVWLHCLHVLDWRFWKLLNSKDQSYWPHSITHTDMTCITSSVYVSHPDYFLQKLAQYLPLKLSDHLNDDLSSLSAIDHNSLYQSEAQLHLLHHQDHPKNILFLQICRLMQV